MLSVMAFKILSVVGTRPNFMKIAALADEFKKQKIDHVLVHTGQHYAKEMSTLFFDELGIPKPDINLDIGSGSYGIQMGQIMQAFEPILQKHKPDLVLVVGDVNSTVAAALVAKQNKFRVAHVEAGLRSFDWDMPEEINRVVTDTISDYLFTTEKNAQKNLENEGIDPKKIFFVGNVMIDTLLKHKKSAQKSAVHKKLGIKKGNYALITLHRPSNVDTKEMLSKLIEMVSNISKKIPIVFPVHPRTRKNISSFNLEKKIQNKDIIITEPQGYLDFLCLIAHAKLVLTDSGGIQEETTVLGVPCITLRENTERPVTIEQGTNILLSTDTKKIEKTVNDLLSGKIIVRGKIPELWDGKAAQRIVQILLK